MDLTGKRVLITAAAQGIGRASVEAYLEAGAEVIAADINQQALADLPGAQTVVLDVTDAAAAQRLAAQFGPLDVLFNCAGVVHAGNILECPESDWAFAMDLNVTAMYRMIRAFLPGMLAAGAGRSSICRRWPPASKACPTASPTAPARPR